MTIEYISYVGGAVALSIPPNSRCPDNTSFKPRLKVDYDANLIDLRL